MCGMSTEQKLAIVQGLTTHHTVGVVHSADIEFGDLAANAD